MGENYDQLKSRVDNHGQDIDKLNIEVAKNKEAQDASIRSVKVLGGLLLAVEVGVMIMALAGIGK